ncbi:MAG: copper chaperone PCu(A)C [Thiomicrorhabdus chilensis]|uniref:copper chaperone PCu(A)C n=1 Tax=Thiomicrorhabdus chilensis TaxID=63656 RepID=UPI00299EF864|nr:copper chaperone PCu(A)C [Thiomicrorhabdus chilensis]MDX1346993.1 copper chaperone PCu(A)C [Thiomicrorhabdus chilensis]
MSYKTNYKTKLTALALGTLTSLLSVAAMATQAEHIEVSEPYAREVPPGAPASASFMTLTNNSDQDIKILQADSEVSKVVELHTHTNDNGVMRMRKIPNITVPANGQAVLQPGGLHIMLIGPHKPLKTGQTVEVELIFEDGSHKSVSMPVKSLKGMNMPMHHENMHNHMH